MEPNEVRKFIEFIKDTDVEELEWESGESKVKIKRSEVVSAAAAESAAQPAGKGAAKKEKDQPIKSPMVGTFFRAQSSDYPPLVMEGNHVTPGQKVAVIEAMKIMKDVISNLRGKITKVLVQDGQPVEYGQDLFIVDTSDVNNNSKGK